MSVVVQDYVFATYTQDAGTRGGGGVIIVVGLAGRVGDDRGGVEGTRSSNKGPRCRERPTDEGAAEHCGKAVL